jgi:subtilisin family serine protease
MWKTHKKLVLRLIIAVVLVIPGTLVMAKAVNLEPLDSDGKRSWIVELADPPVVRFDGKNAATQSANTLNATAPEKNDQRLDLLSPQSVAYTRYLDDRMEQFLSSTASVAGGAPEIRARYKNLLNGVALRLTEEQAKLVRALPGVKNVIPNEIHHIETDAGPVLIGASQFWTGVGGLPSAQGEGIVIGIIDTGINWDHVSFQDPAPDGYNHTNPFGNQLGECSKPEVPCNDKLIGVYDFTDEGSMGKGTHFHGSLVASVAAGNRLNVVIEGVNTQLQGVAPRANIISYKACREDDPATEEVDEEGCPSTDIISGLEQALTDGVDVVNMSLGGGQFSPWSTYDMLFLDLRNAGVFTATSAGNNGPDPSSGTNPGLAPWVLAVAAASHTRLTGARLENLSGGATTPPQGIAGEGLDPINGSPNGVGPVDIVFAGDFGNALCGTGEAAVGVPSCNEISSASNPFAPGTFNGEIVVCERGNYGRVEKGLNVMLAGAGGYILINSESFGESLRLDNHCIPGIHVGYSQGKELKTWLASGGGHMGTMGPFGLSYENGVADILADFSSQGPNTTVPGTLVPDITAPGVSILGAGKENNDLESSNGTSFSSPHVAGGGALLLSADPSLTPSQLQSMIQTTATTQVRSYKGNKATPFEMGSGRIQLAEAFHAGLFMHVTGQEFLLANPATGGDPSSLNLPSLVNESCQGMCRFSRTVTDRAGGGTWTASAQNFPAGTQISITPANFSLSSGASQTLTIDFILAPETIGDWVFGEILLTSTGLPDQHLTVAVSYFGGDLPPRWDINSSQDGGWVDFLLKLPSALPDATFTSSELVKPDKFSETLIEDPSRDDPYDNIQGVMTQWFQVPENTHWFSNRTLTSSATDLDLYVGHDSDGDGIAEESELLCESITPSDIENCDLLSPVAGDYWVLVQNWAASGPPGDEATLASAIVGPSGDSRLAATGPGIIAADEPFKVRLSWDNVNALPGEEWLSAVSIGSTRDKPGNIGIVPVHFERKGFSAAATFPLMNGTMHGLALEASGMHDRIFIDVPAGASSLTVMAEGATAAQSNGLMLELSRLDFDEGLTDPPFATAADGAPVVASATGNNGNGPSLTISGATLEPGRWYAILRNQINAPLAVNIHADVEFSGAPIPIYPGLWAPSSRPGIAQGYDYSFGGPNRVLIWYTYDEDGQPVWFIASNPEVTGNIWTADLLRVTNDGAQQHSTIVGQVSVSLLSLKDSMFSYTLYGESGTDRMRPLTALTCPDVNGTQESYNALWFRGESGLGGASILVNDVTQAQIHYLYDAFGIPRWFLAQNVDEPAPTHPDLPVLQVSGFCAVCASAPVTTQTVGLLSRSFSSETTGSWTLDYMFAPPLTGSVMRTDQIIKLTDTIACE